MECNSLFSLVAVASDPGADRKERDAALAAVVLRIKGEDVDALLTHARRCASIPVEVRPARDLLAEAQADADLARRNITELLRRAENGQLIEIDDATAARLT